MSTNTKTMNTALYNASVHLLEASNHLNGVPEFEDQAIVLLLMAEHLVNIIHPDVQKMTMDNMASIMSEIAAFAGVNE